MHTHDNLYWQSDNSTAADVWVVPTFSNRSSRWWKRPWPFGEFRVLTENLFYNKLATNIHCNHSTFISAHDRFSIRTHICGRASTIFSFYGWQISDAKNNDFVVAHRSRCVCIGLRTISKEEKWQKDTLFFPSSSSTSSTTLLYRNRMYRMCWVWAKMPFGDGQMRIINTRRLLLGVCVYRCARELLRLVSCRFTSSCVCVFWVRLVVRKTSNKYHALRI